MTHFYHISNHKRDIVVIFIDNSLFKIHLSIRMIQLIKVDLLTLVSADDFALETDCLTGRQ